MDGDVCVTMCETAWMRRQHTANAQSEVGVTVTMVVDCVDVDRVAKPPYISFLM